MTYPDSSFIVSLYVEDANTAAAKNYLRKNADTLTLTDFSKSEAQHAIRTLGFRKHITLGEMTQALLFLERDLDLERFDLKSESPHELFSTASQLSNRYALQIGVRYLDMLHVACALLIQAEHFLTFDLRQRKLAHAAGLNVKI